MQLALVLLAALARVRVALRVQRAARTGMMHGRLEIAKSNGILETFGGSHFMVQMMMHAAADGILHTTLLSQSVPQLSTGMGVFVMLWNVLSKAV